MTKMGMASALVVVVVMLGSMLAVSDAHLCVFFPPQRDGFYNINQVGSMSCFILQRPCGKTEPQNPIVTLHAGTLYNVTFQKNENHWFPAKPGEFEVSYSPRTLDPHFTVLNSTPDTNATSLTIYSVPIRIPVSQASTHGVLQVKYVTNNVIGPFYQCSDIAVV